MDPPLTRGVTWASSVPPQNGDDHKPKFTRLLGGYNERTIEMQAPQSVVVDSNSTRGSASRSVCCFLRLVQGVLWMLLERACEGVAWAWVFVGSRELHGAWRVLMSSPSLASSFS